MKSTEKPSPKLSEFINSEVKKRGISLTKLADMMGVDGSTVTRAANPEKAPMPTLDFLAKLARVTQVDICTLLSLAFPDVAGGDDSNARLLVARIRRLPADSQAVVESFINNALFEGKK